MIRPRTLAIGRRAWPFLITTVLILGVTASVDGARAATTHSPFGRLDAVAQSGTSLAIRGWAIDPDSRLPIHVHVYLDGRIKGAVVANASRPDVAKAHPYYGAGHGFSARVSDVSAGTHKLCAYGIDVGLGSNSQLGCRTVTVNYDPIGAITATTQNPGGFTATGWTFDRDQPRPALTVAISVDGKLTAASTANLLRPDVAKAHPLAGAAHGFSIKANATEGSHAVCLRATNKGLGADAPQLSCRTVTLNFSPVGAITSLTEVPGGYRVQGWALDPDTTAPIHVDARLDDTKVAGTTANLASGVKKGHGYDMTVPLGPGTTAGAKTICVNGGNAAGTPGASRYVACRIVNPTFRPYGGFNSVVRIGGLHVQVTGWAIDPDTRTSIAVEVTIDGTVVGTPSAGVRRVDVGAKYPAYGSFHGLSAEFGVNPGEHKVCLTAVNTRNGTGDTALGCKIINAVHPVPPSAPKTITAVGGYGSATITWTAPASDGGAPWTGYTVTASPGGRSVSVGPTATSATITGLAPKTHYSFNVVARNIAGGSLAAHSKIILTAALPPPQTTPAPISTSRYVRNLAGSSSTYLNRMRAEGATDAAHNPTGHRYVILLDIGGQDERRHGVVLSATTRFVSYADLVRDLNAYVDGYASKQRAGAPVLIAIGTNNDMDVSSSSGATWARSVVNPIVSHATKYSAVRIAGANDIEPGFRASYAQSKAWVTGYLGNTRAAFVFNGSADGCAWTATNRGCNNGWSMAGLYQLSAGAAPSRIINLPQVYNNTMAAQWKYISLTGVGQRKPKINFGGALTEWTACAQVGGCGSLTGRNAWLQMWSQLRSHPALRPQTLPYSTDLRIDR